MQGWNVTQYWPQKKHNIMSFVLQFHFRNIFFFIFSLSQSIYFCTFLHSKFVKKSHLLFCSAWTHSPSLFFCMNEPFADLLVWSSHSREPYMFIQLAADKSRIHSNGLIVVADTSTTTRAAFHCHTDTQRHAHTVKDGCIYSRIKTLWHNLQRSHNFLGIKPPWS